MYIKGNRKCFNMSDKSGIAVGTQKLDSTFDFGKCYSIDFTHFYSLFEIPIWLFKNKVKVVLYCVMGRSQTVRLLEEGGR